MLQFPAPNLLGAPARFDKWRKLQADAVQRAAYSSKRFIGTGAPTGFGKSLVYVTQALLTDARTVILTSTKALQSQLFNDFSESGLIEIKGMNAYECIEGTPTGRFGDYRREGQRSDRGLPMSCEEAPCQSGAFCPRKSGGCLYYDAYRRASNLSSRLVVTNYQYWMHINRWGEGLGDFDLLVLDEAHQAVDELGSFIGTEIRQSEIETVLPSIGGSPVLLDVGADAIDWKSWGDFWCKRATSALETIKAAIAESERLGMHRTGARVDYGTLKRAKALRRLAAKLGTIASIDADWIIDDQVDNHFRRVVKFDPVWPGAYAERYLMRDIKKVVLVSATIRPETADMLNIKRSDMDFQEYPSSFPIANRPIIYLPTVHMNRNSEKAGMKEMAVRVDHTIGRRLDRKGLIQTVSYDRARAIFAHSEYKSIMVMHDNTNTREVIDMYKKAKPPLVLISPVVDTGYDFPYEEAEYQIIVKVPFPVTTDKIMKARQARNPRYKDLVTAITLTQQAGRIVRAEDDRGETFIFDSDFGWWYFRNENRILFARWFQEAVRTDQWLKEPLPKLQKR